MGICISTRFDPGWFRRNGAPSNTHPKNNPQGPGTQQGAKSRGWRWWWALIGSNDWHATKAAVWFRDWLLSSFTMIYVNDELLTYWSDFPQHIRVAMCNVSKLVWQPSIVWYERTVHHFQLQFKHFFGSRINCRVEILLFHFTYIFPTYISMALCWELVSPRNRNCILHFCMKQHREKSPGLHPTTHSKGSKYIAWNAAKE